MEFIRFFGLRGLSVGHWGSRCFDTCYYDFLSLIKLYLVIFYIFFLFLMSLNSEEKLFHILIPW